MRLELSQCKFISRAVSKALSFKADVKMSKLSRTEISNSKTPMNQRIENQVLCDAWEYLIAYLSL